MVTKFNKYSLILREDESFEYDYSNSKIINPTEVRDLINSLVMLNVRAEEYFIMLGLDTKNFIIGIFVVSQGSLNASLVHPREVFKRAIVCNSARIILSHNHPSGDAKPSSEDITITQKLKKGGELLGIEVLDHIIIGKNNTYFSFKEDGML